MAISRTQSRPENSSRSDAETENEPPPRLSCPWGAASAMNTGLYRYLQGGQSDALQRLLEDEEEGLLDQLSPENNTPLHIVARRGNHRLIQTLLTRRPSQLTHQNIHGDLALHLASGAGHLAAVKSILEGLEDSSERHVIKKQNEDGDTPLHVALRHKYKKVARYLFEACPECSYSLNLLGESPLFLAAQSGELELVKDMIEVPLKDDLQTELVENGLSIVHAAISAENLDGRLPEEISSSPLSYAAFKGNIQIIRYLLKRFPDLAYRREHNGILPIHKAAATGNEMVVEEFLHLLPESRESLTLDGQNILHVAATHGKDNVVSYILSKPDLDNLINARDKRGNTPLHCSAYAKYPTVVVALTWDKRVKLDVLNKIGQAAMDVALDHGNMLHSLKEQLTWAALRQVDAPWNGRLQAERLKKPVPTELFKDRVNTLSVIATLVTTISFAAGFTIPGGNKGSEPNPGMANFLERQAFQLFVISNSVALYTAVLAVLALIFAIIGDATLLRVSFRVTAHLLAVSLTMMSIAFMSAAYLVVSALVWLGIMVWVLGFIFLAAVLTLFMLLFPPMSTRNRFTRYASYLPFRALLYICERK